MHPTVPPDAFKDERLEGAVAFRRMDRYGLTPARQGRTERTEEKERKVATCYRMNFYWTWR